MIVPAVPTVEPLFLITTPEPEATIPVRPAPSPMKVVAVTTPVILLPPVPVTNLLNSRQNFHNFYSSKKRECRLKKLLIDLSQP